jgi:hypothetical protein
LFSVTINKARGLHQLLLIDYVFQKRKPDVAPSEFYHLLLRRCSFALNVLVTPPCVCSGVQLVATYAGSEDIKFDGSCKKVARLLRRDREGELFIVAKALPMDRKPMSRAEWLRSARPDDHLLERFTSGLAAGLSSR